MGQRIEIEELIKKLLAELTLEEKIRMVHGVGLFRTGAVERLGIPSLYMSDGPMGVRAEFKDDAWVSAGNSDDYVTYLPCNSALASTWNKALAARMGETLGCEARGRGKDVILAPGVNIKRSPLCGRNFEYMSEDPHVIEELAAPFVQGVQKSDAAACVKHFTANSQESGRLQVDTIVDERTLREIYFPGFLAAVKGGVYSVMGAYNKVNGEHCCMSKRLLNDILRKEWGFDGVIVSDWGGVHDTALAAESALDIEMNVTYNFDEYYMAAPLLQKIRDGEIAESLLDEKVRNILRLMYRLHMIGDAKKTRKSGTYNAPEHRQAVLEAARESVILLKNEENLLPLQCAQIKTLAVIGQNAVTQHANGGGSAEIRALYEITPLMGIKKLLGGNVKVTYEPGYVTPKKQEDAAVNWQADSARLLDENDVVRASGADGAVEIREAAAQAALEKQRETYQARALAAAKTADAVIFIGGLTHEDDIEGKDRTDMKLPYGQDALLGALLEERPDTVVVMCAGSPVEMPWQEKAKAILWSYYAGMEGGTALAEVLFGHVNPSGKLAETFPKNHMQCPAHLLGAFGDENRVSYEEGVFVGYRYYDTKDTDVAFCFGHGLSYTAFSYADLQVSPVETDGEIAYEVSAVVENTGKREGTEIVQFYVAPKNPAVERPSHELRAFVRLLLQPGEKQRVAVMLDKKAFSYYNTDKKAFTAERGRYEIQMAASSRDIRLRREIEVDYGQA